MTRPISVQLYSVREAMAEDFPGTIRQIADAGYVGVEPAGLPEGVSPREFAAVVQDHGMVVSAWQGGTPVGDDAARLLDGAEAMGAPRVVCPFHAAENWGDLDGIKRSADVFRAAIENCGARGLTFGYHNHDFELALVDGRPGLLRMHDILPELNFTVDTYWVQVGGQDPVAVVRELGPQASLLHIKDGPLVKTDPMVAVGSGKMDFPPIVAAAEHAEWLVVELDRCATDMLEAVAASARYLAAAKLGRLRANG